MKKHHLPIWALSALLLLAAAFALRLVFAPPRAAAPAQPREKPPRDTSIVKWRVPISSGVECLDADYNGWVVGERSGRITALESDGGIRWQVAFSNCNWQGILALPCSREVVAVSLHGTVCMLNLESGKTLWTRETDGTFMHAPLWGVIGVTPVFYLISQSDSIIFCLRKNDGEVLWKSEPSNRCDGEPSLWRGRLTFGNCDGVVYVVDADTGQSLGTIETGGQEDPMAGAMVVLEHSGLLVTGTYLGNFLLLDPTAMTCLDKVQIAGGEAFATPVVIDKDIVAMGTPDGRITLWDTSERKLKSVGEIPIGKDGIDEMVFSDKDHAIWFIAGRIFGRLDTQTHQVQTFNIGDNMKCLVHWGELALLADGDVVCIEVLGETE
ncbi:MAG: PQQ-binding-like beta-propeller repeat protein [Kiritimatiellaeota bacterium]|nr:PQQ-binding-like beta-propeller repeat protein [Kiritimatiellota bacterium]